MAEDKPKTQKKAEKLELAPLPGTDEAVTWVGEPVDDSGGERIGKVSGVHADADSGDPKWLIVKLGRFAGDAAVPFEHTAEGGGRVWVAYTRDEVRSSPKMSAGQTLSSSQEIQLCAHYGIREGVGRAAEVAGRDDDEISAVPVGG